MTELEVYFLAVERGARQWPRVLRGEMTVERFFDRIERLYRCMWKGGTDVG